MHTRRDVAEIFDRWAPTYDECTLQPLYQAAHRAVLDIARRGARTPQGILDVGCGTATMLRRLANEQLQAIPVGVDVSHGMLRAARPGTHRLVVATAEQLPFRDSVFDLVLSTISLRHWLDPRAALGEIGRVMTPGGLLVVATVATIDRRRRADSRRSSPSMTQSCLSVPDFRAVGLGSVRIRRIDGYGPVPTITVVSARRSNRRRRERLRDADTVR